MAQDSDSGKRPLDLVAFLVLDTFLAVEREKHSGYWTKPGWQRHGWVAYGAEGPFDLLPLPSGWH